MRYLYTREAAAILKTHPARAWRILRDAGVRPIGREIGPPPLVIWRGADVRQVARRRAGKDTRTLRIEANILRGVRQRRAKRGQS